MTTKPDFIIQKCTVSGPSYAAVVQECIDAFSSASVPDIKKWSMPSEKKMRTGDTTQLLAALSAADKESITDGMFEMGDGVSATIYDQKIGGKGRFTLELTKELAADPSDRVSDFVSKAVRVCQNLLKQNVLLNASVYRDGGGLACVPDVPLVDTTSHVAVVSEKQVIDAYDNPDAFWAAGWDDKETFGERFLLIRGVDIESDLDYLEILVPAQWAMARASRPGTTAYYLPSVEPDEEPIYSQGERTVEIVGHLSGENVLELTCELAPGSSINGWEIFDLLGLIENGELPDGRKVDVVRVVFLEHATAIQEKRVLLDIGVEVQSYNDDGELLQLTE